MTEKYTARVKPKPESAGSFFRIQRTISNKAGLSISSGKVSLSCPICGLIFERYACWAKRVNVSYCSRACSAEGRRIEVEMQCRNCGENFTIKPSKVGIIFSCSIRCRDAHTRKNSKTKRKSGWKEYKKAAQHFKSNGCECRTCGTNVGPFVARYPDLEDGATVEEILGLMSAQCYTCYGRERLSRTRNHSMHYAGLVGYWP